jgi:dUTP pyrophosphatase
MYVSIVFSPAVTTTKQPSVGTELSSGIDLRADIAEPMTIKAGQRALIPTGIRCSMSRGMEMQIRSRSGLTLKQGICVANGVGTIDADYRGPIGVILLNTDTADFIVEPNMRIAQAVICPIFPPDMVDFVSSIDDDTQRGSGGFGSTGVE